MQTGNIPVQALLFYLTAVTTTAATMPQAESIVWGECRTELDSSALPTIQCGKLTVPLDWTHDKTNETIELELIKMPAATQPAPKGSILLNFGGPGGDGLNNFVINVPFQAPYVNIHEHPATNETLTLESNSTIGEDFDIISWDPRGTRNTIPVICYDNTTLNAAFQTYLTDWYNSSDTTPSKLWSEATTLSELCRSRLQEIGPYVGMASVARDIMAIVDSLDEDGLLRYWGISGGTTMGATVAAMFPDKMDKVVLDGVMNVHEYYNSLLETELVSSADNIIRGIFTACIAAGVEKCPLARHGTTCESLEALFDKLLDDLKYDPIPFVFTELGTGLVVDYNAFLNWIFLELYYPDEYPVIAAVLDGLFDRNATAFAIALASPTSIFPTLNNVSDSGALRSGRHAEADSASSTSSTSAAISTSEPEPISKPVWGIRCGDRRPRAAEKETLQPDVVKLEANSKWFAHFGLGTNGYLCAQWPFEAAERYEGSFLGVKTKNPILFVGNTYDPVTPLVSAHNVSAGFVGSVVLQHDSYGHVSFYTQRSNCTDNAIHAYLNEGTMPAQGTVCAPNRPLVDYVSGEVPRPGA